MRLIECMLLLTRASICEEVQANEVCVGVASFNLHSIPCLRSNRKLHVSLFSAVLFIMIPPSFLYFAIESYLVYLNCPSLNHYLM